KFLTRKNIKAEAIHGNKSQNARQRALGNFKSGETRVLVATDIAARGIDVDDLEYVINIDLPNVAETYVHRIGRTGRAGNRGTAYSFCNAEEKEYLRDIEKLIDKSIQVIDNHPYPMMNFEVEAPKPRVSKRGNGGQQKPKETPKLEQKSSAKRSGRKRRYFGKRG
ncbi:MAG TPA: ATP-dependent helicase, partial [Chlorobaculum parvum]|nr:ATP-dependent helicase [Chlorobaculum parvum]